MSNHTPGPWGWEENAEHNQVLLYYAGEDPDPDEHADPDDPCFGLSHGDGIAVFEHQSLAPSRADRALIAASPDLLEACKDMLDQLSYLDEGNAKADAAISKAEPPKRDPSCP